MNEEFSDSNSIDANSINTELQVRLMNLVMGEASDFELDQLQLLMEQRSEVAAFYQHLEHLHGLLCEVGAGELAKDTEPAKSEDAWQLSADRREKLLAVLDGTDQLPLAKVVLASSLNTKQKSVGSRWWATAGVIVTVASVLLFLILLPSVQSARSVARRYSLEMTRRTDNGLDFTDATPAATNTRLLDSEKGASTSSSNDYYSQPFAYGRFDVGASERYLNSSTSQNEKFSESAPNAGYEQPKAPVALAINETAKSPTPEVLGWEGIAVPTVSALGVEQLYSYSVNVPREEATTVTVPDGGKILSGGMLKTRETHQRDRFDDNAKDAVDGVKIKMSKEDGFIDALNDVDHAAAPIIDVNSFRFPDASNASSTLMQTVTPSIILQEEEEVRYAENSKDFRQMTPGKGEPNAAMQSDGSAPPVTSPSAEVWKKRNGRGNKPSGPAGKDDQPQTKVADFDSLMDSIQQTVDPDSWLKADGRYPPALSIVVESKNDGEASRPGLSDKSNKILDASKEVVPEPKSGSSNSSQQTGEQNAPELTLEQKTDSTHDARDRNWFRSEASKGGRRRALAPSPEIASSTRDRVALEGKPAAPKQAEAIDEQSASSEAFSTFSLHVSDVSFKLAQTALSQGQWPDAAKIRIEEFVNALDYHDPLPSGNQKVACRVEQAIHPFLMQRNLLRVSMRTAATGRAQNTPLRLTLLLDNSGSMERPDRRQAVLRAFQTLTQQLSATDQITLISFASTPRLLADKVPGNQGETLLQLIANLPSEGGTNIEAALLLAREKATEQQLAGAQNRIILLTDGAVNLGNANPDSLAKLVTQMRDTGIAFDAAGISAQDLNDEVLEALTRQGDGRYYLLDSAESVAETFASQIAGALRPTAQNVKVQVEFNPQRVGRYKLLGFEKHRLDKEDFRNDQVDAAEMAAAEAGVAVYQFEIKPNGSGDVGSVSVRFRDLSTGQMIERRWPIPYESNAPRLEQAEASMQLAASAALFAAKLSGGPLGDSVDLEQLKKLLSTLSEQCASQLRVHQLRTMIEQAKAIEH